ncbi:unnamed protein product [Polarella glacialis]|uniref:Uncharacterized protein n=1 Tax=Polarella glacialis TaxID=89957 RepID=A0A813DDW8_POLGL|nr:unnamed protein product [Polarella glacialis]
MPKASSSSSSSRSSGTSAAAKLKKAAAKSLCRSRVSKLATNPRGSGSSALPGSAAAAPVTGAETAKWKKLNVKVGKGWEDKVCEREPPVLRLRYQQQPSSSRSRARNVDRQLTVTMRARKSKLLHNYQASKPEAVLKQKVQRLFDGCRYPATSVVCEVRHLRPARIPSDIAGGALSGVPLPFRVPNNAMDSPSEQPPHFKRHPLRPEQLRSLGWMISREQGAEADFEAEWRKCWVDPGKCSPSEQEQIADAVGIDGPDYYGEYGAPTEDDDSSEDEFGDRSDDEGDFGRHSYGYGYPYNGQNEGRGFRRHRQPKRKPLPFTVDLRVRATFSVRGGILADKIGYGKTAATIGLIDAGLSRPDPPLPAWDKQAFLPTKATLILVPGNLLEQWLGEISKFTGDGAPLKGQMDKGWVSKESYDGAFKVFACTSVTPLKTVSVQALAEADVVLCTYRLLFSQIYRDRLRQLAGGYVQGSSEFSAMFGGGKKPGSKKNLPKDQVAFDDVKPQLRGGTLAMLREVTRRLRSNKVSVPSPSDPRNRKSESTPYEHVRSASELRFPVLEMFYWRRVVFDEFHELEGFPADQQTSLQHLRAHYRWGLTGTPPLDSVSGSIFMSSLFRVDLTGSNATDPTWDSDRLLAESSAKFLDLAARQNTAEIPGIKLANHIVHVRQTDRERILYLGQARDAGVQTGTFDMSRVQDEAQREAYERLIKLCSHFQVGSVPRGKVLSAAQECNRIHEQKERAIVEERNRVARGLRAVALLEQKLPKGRPTGTESWQRVLSAAAVASGETEQGKEAANFFALEQDVTRKLKPADLPSELDGFRPQAAELKNLLGKVPPKDGMKQAWKTFAGKRLTISIVERLLLALAKETAASLKDVREAMTSLSFFTETLRVFQENSTSRACSVCLQGDLPLSMLAITPCSHVFCIKCLRACVQRYKRCSLCNTHLAEKDVMPLVKEIEAADRPKASSSSSSSSSWESPAPAPKRAKKAECGKYGKFGSKLAAIVEKLLEIRAEDATAKVILFTQFDDLKLKIAAALKEFAIPMAQLQGAPGQRDKVIRNWQNDKTADQFVLLLSLEQSASGTNLTAASHVILVHPMLAATREKAVSFEMQAIGRARRHGQLKDTVHVWRFVTLDTVEEEMTTHHQADMDGFEVVPTSNKGGKRRKE